MRHARLAIFVVAAAACTPQSEVPTAEEIAEDAERIGAVVDGPGDASAGRGIFRANCSPCHGENGEGDGPAAESLEVPPRDLTSGRFKFTSTRPGQPPTDGDLYRTVARGISGTAMPPWRRQFDDQDIWDVVQYVKRLSPAFEGATREGVPIPTPPEATDASVAKGKNLYEQYGCGTCHGSPETDRPQPILTDFKGRRIEATQFADEPLAGGSQPRDVYRCIAVGIGGTPMPAFYEALETAETWHLVHYVRSLGD